MSEANARQVHQQEDFGPAGGRLTARQERFVEEFLVDLNGTQAAMRAGYSTKTARSIAQENLTKPAIVTAIQKAKAKRAERVQLTADDVLNRFWDVASVSVTDFIEWTNESWRVKSSNEVPPSARAAIQSINIKQDGSGLSISVRMHDKLRALEACGKHLGLFGPTASKGEPEFMKVLRQAQEALARENA
jgi:phage terminase small subunit